MTIPKAVYKECVIEGKENAKKIKNTEWIKIAKINDINLKKNLVMEIDEGEAEAIVLALENLILL